MLPCVADVLQHVQVVAVRCIRSWLEVDLLHEVIVPVGLPLGGPHGGDIVMLPTGGDIVMLVM